jgi:hypothetical protein
MKLNHLPDEILLLILKNLNNFEVLYYFHDVNQRLKRITHDPIFTSHLNLVKWSCNKMINKFCSQILPEICEKVKWFNLESSLIRDILSSNKYSNLCGVNLYNVDETTINFLFTGKKIFK